jgi:hypothetical protein
VHESLLFVMSHDNTKKSTSVPAAVRLSGRP